MRRRACDVNTTARKFTLAFPPGLFYTGGSLPVKDFRNRPDAGANARFSLLSGSELRNRFLRVEHGFSQRFAEKQCAPLNREARTDGAPSELRFPRGSSPNH